MNFTEVWGMRRKIQLRIGGMTCTNCQRRIENRLNFTKGVLHAAVSYRAGLAHVT